MDEVTERRGFNGRGDSPAPDAGPGTAGGTLVEPAVVDETGGYDDDYDDQDDAPDDEDEDLLPAEGRSPVNRWTVGLVAAVLMVASFGAGAYAQRSTGDSTVAAPGAGGFARQGAGGSGRLGGFGAPGGQVPGQGTGASAPVVVGQVVSVSGTTLTVRNFAGATVKVTVPDGTSVSVSSTVALSGLRPGTAVSVTGTRGSDGTVNATGVTARAVAKEGTTK